VRLLEVALIATALSCAFAGMAVAQPAMGAFAQFNPLQVKDLDSKLQELSVTDLQNLTLGDVSGLGEVEDDDLVPLYDFNPKIDLTNLVGLPSESKAQLFRDMTTVDGAPSIKTQLSSFAATFPGVSVAGDLPWAHAFDDPAQLADFQLNVSRLAAAPAAEQALRIYHGTPVGATDPYSDALMLFGQRSDGSIALCSAVLVDPSTALTAAHCVCPKDLTQALVGSSFMLPHQQVGVDVDKNVSLLDCSIFGDPTKYAAGIGAGDVGIVHFTTPVTAITPHKIAIESAVEDAASVRAVGYGSTVADGGAGLQGKYVVDIVVASKDCSDIDRKFPNAGYRCETRHEMVAAGGDRDTCAGDSGAPIYIFGTTDAVLYLAGLTSRAVDPTGKCGPGGIYEKLSDPHLKSELIAHGIPASSFVVP